MWFWLLHLLGVSVEIHLVLNLVIILVSLSIFIFYAISLVAVLNPWLVSSYVVVIVLVLKYTLYLVILVLLLLAENGSQRGPRVLVDLWTVLSSFWAFSYLSRIIWYQGKAGCVPTLPILGSLSRKIKIKISVENLKIPKRSKSVHSCCLGRNCVLLLFWPRFVPSFLVTFVCFVCYSVRYLFPNIRRGVQGRKSHKKKLFYGFGVLAEVVLLFDQICV